MKEVAGLVGVVLIAVPAAILYAIFILEALSPAPKNKSKK